MIYVASSAALNFTPHAKILAASVKQHIPKSKFVFCLADRDTPALEKETIFDEVYSISEVIDNVKNLTGWIFGHNLMELATAVKPFLLKKLLSQPDCEAVLYFDADSKLFGYPKDIFELLNRYSILVTPHITKPTDSNATAIREWGPLLHGVFNLGFLGLKNDDEANSLINWWKERLLDLCTIDPHRGLFTDQKWFNLLPCLFDNYYIIKNPGYNLSEWNSYYRKLTERDGRYYVNGEPLVMYHFAGLALGRHESNIKENAHSPDCFLKLVEKYKEELTRNQDNECYVREWAYLRYANGRRIEKTHRTIYRNHPEIREVFTNPFDGGLYDYLDGKLDLNGNIIAVPKLLKKCLQSAYVRAILQKLYRLAKV